MAPPFPSERETPVAPYVPLPRRPDADPHATRATARASFNEVAEVYDRARPGYPEALFDDLRAHGLHPGATVLEVGCGTGQATRRLAELAREVHCVELGAELARRAEHNLASFPNVRVEVGAFEEVELADAGFDMVFSATAFHWIDPVIAYPRAAHLLGTDGVLALVTNAHVAGGTQSELMDAIHALHAELCPEIGPWRFPPASDVVERARRPGDIATVWSRVERSFHPVPDDVTALFGPPFVGVYEWTERYDRARYLDMLATQSSYIGLDPDCRRRLLDGIGALVDDRLGGEVTKAYLAILAVAPVQV